MLAASQVASHLEEMLSLAKASEQYRQYMMGSMQDAVAPAPLDPSVDNTFTSGQFTITIRELIAYYIAMVSHHEPTFLHRLGDVAALYVCVIHLSHTVLQTPCACSLET